MLAQCPVCPRKRTWARVYEYTPWFFLNASINASAFPFHRQACEAVASTRWDISAEPNADESSERHEPEKSIHGD
jgi:hypothetical protein